MDLIQIAFEYTTKYGVYRDAIYLPPDHGLTDADINSMKHKRVQDWIAVIESSSEILPDG